jgi:arachidonate 15-lipoxygenase
MASGSGDSNNQSKSLIKLAELLIALHIQRRYFLYKDYTYNYNYLQPLAITNVPESKFLSKILGISFPNFPEGSFPSLIWLVKVVVRLIVIAINNFLIQSFGSFNLLTNDLIEIKQEVRNIGADLSELENQSSLKSLVEKLETTLKQINQTLDSDPQLKSYREQQATTSQKDWFQDLIALPILKLNSKIAQLLKLVKPDDAKDIAVLDVSIIASLEKSIKYTTKIAEIADFLGKNSD